MRLVAISYFMFAVLLLHGHSRAQEGLCQAGDIRLAGGSSYLEGRVEVCIRGAWGTVCDDLWDTADASVACKQLGFSQAGAIPFSDAHFGQGSGDIFFDELVCDGNESSLSECLIKNNCFHSEDAGVRCQNSDVALMHEGQLLPNNSLLSLDDLGNLNASTTNPLFCVTTLPSCCDTNRSGNWFPPEGTNPLGTSLDLAQLHQSWGDDQSIQLHRPSGTVPTVKGLYRCEVPDKEGALRVLYVGIYTSPSEGVVEVTSLVYERSSQTLVCISAGGPATSVSWIKDGDPLMVDGINYHQSQVITDTVSATYENRLILVTKTASLSGMYSCLVTNRRGQATNSTEVKVCRNNEVTMVREVDSVTVMVQLCAEDEWLDIVSPLQVQATEPAPRDVQISTNQDGFLLSWEPPITDENITSYDVVCVEQSITGGPTVLIKLGPLDHETLKAIVPVRTISGVNFHCCIKAYIDRYAGVIFTAQSCQTASTSSFIDPANTTRSNTTSTTEVTIPSTALQSNDNTLVFVLGGIAGILFLTLLLVAFALVGLVLIRARSHKADKIESEMDKEYSSLNTDAKPASNPIYDSIDHEAVEAAAETHQESSSNHQPIALRQDIFNPMYTSIDNLGLRRNSSDSRRSSCVSHNSISHNAVLRSNSSSALIGRKVSAGNGPVSVPSYSMIMPRHLRRKGSSPMEVESEGVMPEATTSLHDDDSTSQTYSKLQH